MNLANKLTMSRIYMAVVIILLLLFPFEQLGINLPTFLVNGRVEIELTSIIAGILFIVASITDFFDGRVARKYNYVTDFGKMIDAISDKVLTNSVLIILACNHKVAPIICVIIVIRDIVVDSLKMLVGNKGKAVAAIGIAKWKTATLMFGLIFALFENMPFILFDIKISDYLLIIAAVLSIVSAWDYYKMAKVYLKEK